MPNHFAGPRLPFMGLHEAFPEALITFGALDLHTRAKCLLFLHAVVANCLPETARVQFMTFLATAVVWRHLNGAARRDDGQLSTLHSCVSLSATFILCATSIAFTRVRSE